MPSPSWRQDAATGQLVPGTTVTFSRCFTQADLESFGDLTRDYNPVHYDPRWSALKGFDDPICHGLLVGSMLCQIGGQWGWLATGMSFRFRRGVQVGDTITCTLTLTSQTPDERGRLLTAADVRYTNQHGELVLTAEVEGYLPDPDAQALLGSLLAEGDPTNPL